MRYGLPVIFPLHDPGALHRASEWRAFSARRSPADKALLVADILVGPSDHFMVEKSLPCGHVHAIKATMERLGMTNIIASKPCRERDLVLAMIAQRILQPDSKLGTIARFSDTTLGTDFGVDDANEDDLYNAMDWALKRQPFIEKKLAHQHLKTGGRVFYDLSSSSDHGSHCPLAAKCHNRDGLKLPAIAYGLLTDNGGRPVAISVYPGNTGDPATVADQVQMLRKRFGIARFVLVACFNPLLAMDRQRTRNELLAATEVWLKKLVAEIARRTEKPQSAAQIGQKLGRGINRDKVAKLFEIKVADNHLSWTRKQDAIAREKALDGIYVIRTPEPVEEISSEDAVRAYKQLGDVEKAFRTLKGLDLHIRPIHHRLEARVRAHIFLCMLAYYVEWHMREALAPLLFVEENLTEARAARDPVAKAAPTASAKAKKSSKHTADGHPLRVCFWRRMLGLLFLKHLYQNLCDSSACSWRQFSESFD